VTLAKAGIGAKTVTRCSRPTTCPSTFRLLSDSLYGYAWPKWSSGGASEFRVHSPSLLLTLLALRADKELVRPIGWFDEHGPRANSADPPGRRLHADRRRTGIATRVQPRCVRSGSRGADSALGLYYVHAETPSGKFLSFPWVVAPAEPSAKSR
jgi:hypothetical protein